MRWSCSSWPAGCAQLFRRRAAPGRRRHRVRDHRRSARCCRSPAQAQDDAAALRATLQTRLAYVITGNDEVDRISRAGLQGLTLFLAQRTALEAGDPVGIDPGKDELAFYPLIYWPMVPGAARPSREALEHIDAYMKNGGTVLFDTRDAIEGAPGGGSGLAQHAGAAHHPLLARHPRARGGAARPRADQDVLPAQGVSRPLRRRPALGRSHRDRNATTKRRSARRAPATASPRSSSRRTISPAPGRCGRTARRCCRWSASEPRQREFAFRAGVNIVMYTLTGNYKADQVHVPALLETVGAVGEFRESRHLIRSARSRLPRVVGAGCCGRARDPAARVAQPRRLRARRRDGAVRAGARQPLVHPRGPRSADLGRDRRGRQEREPGIRRPHQADRGGARRALRAARAAFPISRCASSRPANPSGEADGTRLFTALQTALERHPERARRRRDLHHRRPRARRADRRRDARLRRAGACADHRPPERARPPRRAGHDAALRHRRAVADHRLPRRGPGRAGRATRRSPCAATARRSTSATCASARRSASTCRSRMRDRTSSRSRRRRSTTS